MNSILLSFVGNQDPYSNNTEQEGSIVTLVNHLLAQQHHLKQVILLHTADTQTGANDTKTWLTTAPASLPETAIHLQAVDPGLSQDPVNLLLAVQAARAGIELAQTHRGETDWLEFNASSGTPVMKSAWSILQAAGHAPHSRIWQVRNPKEMQPGQDRVFTTDVTTLKTEFDLKVIQQQVQDYNYQGALTTLRASHLQIPEVEALLNYGFYRVAMDFDQAFSCLGQASEATRTWWQRDVAPLRQKQVRALLQEAYFNMLIRLKTHQYADFLVGLFKLQEQLLYYLVQDVLCLPISGKPGERDQSWQCIRQVDQGQLYQFLQGYTLPNGELVHLDRAISRYVLQGIVEYYPCFRDILPLIRELNQYCALRNEFVHGFVGVSAIDNQANLLRTLQSLMQKVTGISPISPFDRLNQNLYDRLHHLS